jgi:hypothetical protein
VKTYWQQQIFAGRSSPPAEKSSDADIVAFVAATTGAVGYVSQTAPVGDGVRVLTVSP